MLLQGEEGGEPNNKRPREEDEEAYDGPDKKKASTGMLADGSDGADPLMTGVSVLTHRCASKAPQGPKSHVGTCITYRLID